MDSKIFHMCSMFGIILLVTDVSLKWNINAKCMAVSVKCHQLYGASPLVTLIRSFAPV